LLQFTKQVHTIGTIFTYRENMPVTAKEPAPQQEQAVTLYAHIAARFEQLGRPHWTAAVFAWLARYDGINRCYFEDEEASPALEVLRCIAAMENGVSDTDIANALAELEFLSWRVRHPASEERWDPLTLSLAEFIGGDVPPLCWKWEGAYPSSPAIASWLLAQLPQR
jgi:hypothetical protein